VSPTFCSSGRADCRGRQDLLLETDQTLCTAAVIWMVHGAYDLFVFAAHTQGDWRLLWAKLTFCLITGWEQISCALQALERSYLVRDRLKTSGVSVKSSKDKRKKHTCLKGFFSDPICFVFVL
jgi:hypothetical protein